MLHSVPFFSCCSFKNNCGVPSFQEGQHRDTKQEKACSRILETAITDSTFVYWLLHRKVLFLSFVHLLFYLKILQSCRMTTKPEQDRVFLASVSLSLNKLSQQCLHNTAHLRKPILAFMETWLRKLWHKLQSVLGSGYLWALNLALQVEQWSILWNICDCP